VAAAHIERASYWPDPAPDCSVNPCAGGALPTPDPSGSDIERHWEVNTSIGSFSDFTSSFVGYRVQEELAGIGGNAGGRGDGRICRRADCRISGMELVQAGAKLVPEPDR